MWNSTSMVETTMAVFLVTLNTTIDNDTVYETGLNQYDAVENRDFWSKQGGEEKRETAQVQ